MSLALPKLNIPYRPCRIKKQGAEHFIFDPTRKKWLVLTPEEWVRQQLINYLCQDLTFPIEKIKLEFQIDLNGMLRRPDIVVYDQNFAPLVIIECKAPHIKLGADAINQVLAYKKVINARYVFVTNGRQLIEIDDNGDAFFDRKILSWDDINKSV